MKICFLSLRLDLAGGLERVVSQVASILAQKHQVRIGIVDKKTSGTYYPLDERVMIDNLVSCRKRIDMRTIIRRIAYITGWTLPPGLAKQIFYAPDRIDALEAYLREKQFDVVIAAANEPSLLLALIDRKRAGCENTRLYGWFHNTYHAYFHERDYYYGRQSLAKKSLKQLDGLIVLTKQDAQTEQQNLHIKCCHIYNPLSFQSERKSGLNNRVLLFVGRMQYHTKGLDYLLQIAEKIFEKPEWSLSLIHI